MSGFAGSVVAISIQQSASKPFVETTGKTLLNRVNELLV
jgi:hypothetical protein